MLGVTYLTLTSNAIKKRVIGHYGYGCAKKGRYLSRSPLAKGQLISKCPFGVIVWTKIPTIFFENFCPGI